MSQPVDITITRGESLIMEVACKDAEGAVVPLTGATAAMQVRAAVDAIDPLLDLSTSNNTLVIDAPAGVVRIDAPAASTASMPSGVWPYDLWLNLAGGVRMCLAAGQMTVQPNITKVAA